VLQKTKVWLLTTTVHVEKQKKSVGIKLLPLVVVLIKKLFAQKKEFALKFWVVMSTLEWTQ